MNSELKNLVASIFDIENLVQDSVKKNYGGLVMDAMAILGDVNVDVAAFGSLQQELKDLSQSANQADLLAFIQSKIAAKLPSDKAQAILNAVVALITAGIALEQAIVSR